MGYCTTRSRITGREVLTCDSCGGYPSKKYPCPFGYCQAAALCFSCREKDKTGRRAAHRAAGCETAHKAYAAHHQQAAELLKAGKWLRCSALQHEDRPQNHVKVIFRNAARVCRAFFMAHTTYDAIPNGQNATIEDYQAIAPIEAAKNTDIYDAEQGPAPTAHADGPTTKEAGIMPIAPSTSKQD